jgi:hypothetical protein
MIYLVVGIPLLFLGIFTRVYDLGAGSGAETCFWVDGVSQSANCFSKGSVWPYLFKWVPQIGGFGMVLWGVHMSRAARKAAQNHRQNNPPT